MMNIIVVNHHRFCSVFTHKHFSILNDYLKIKFTKRTLPSSAALSPPWRSQTLIWKRRAPPALRTWGPLMPPTRRAASRGLGPRRPAPREMRAAARDRGRRPTPQASPPRGRRALWNSTPPQKRSRSTSR
jgi:hypothetical protein